jgi:transposase
MSGFSRVLGIDVSKSRLDCSLWPSGTGLSVDNDETGLATLAALVEAEQVAAVAVEASGGYERLLVRTLRAQGLTVVLLQPGEVRTFANMRRCRAKNDRIDARVIAEFAAHFGAERPGRDAEAERLAEFLTYYEQASQAVAHARTQRDSFTVPELRDLHEKAIAALVVAKMTALAHLRKSLRQSPRLAHIAALLQSMPGVGFLNAASLAVRLPELGTINRRAIASLVGLAPFDRDSGTRRGARHIAGGRTRVRTMFYMAAMAAIRSCPQYRAIYDKLLSTGKVHKAAVTAVMRRMIVTLNAMVRDQTSWQPAI